MQPKPFLSSLVIGVLWGVIFTGQVAGQCILGNPSFEIAGQGSIVFGAWNQFGTIGSVAEASHGSKAARVSGPDTGDWDVSGFWQSQDCVPGEQWEATGHVRHPASNPLTGQCIAIVSIEWRDSSWNLINDESFAVADASTPTDEYIDFSVLSAPAPAGTAYTIFILGVLQSPDDPSPDVFYDQVTFFSTSPPTMDEQQWHDFPGGEIVTLGGFSWRVKGPGIYGPGINFFCDDPECVWVDTDDRLHLTLQYRDGVWSSTEVTLEEALGYGDYVITTVGRLDQLDPQVVLGIFLWQYGPCWGNEYLWWNPYNEIDIEYSRWGVPGNSIGQFVAQPWDWQGNIERFDATFSDGEVTSHAMRWLTDRVEYRAWRGGPDDESPENMIHTWTYTGPHIPRPEQPRLHLNFWKLEGTPAADQEVVFADFNFVPAGGPTYVGNDPDDQLPVEPAGRLYPAAPNPFNPRTTVRFELDRDSFIELAVYDTRGRLVRHLLKGSHPAGEHRTTWDGRDDQGHHLASGVYLFQLRGDGFAENQRVVLIK